MGYLIESRQPWFSGNRQWSGAIKRVICVLQFDPVALGRRIIYANSWASGSLQVGLQGFFSSLMPTVSQRLLHRSVVRITFETCHTEHLEETILANIVPLTLATT